MSKGTVPIISCDADDGMCGTWTVDYYEQLVESVNGIRVTPTPIGWSGKPGTDEHLCPEHSPEVPF